MRQQIIEAVYKAIDYTNRQREGEPPIRKSMETALFGSSSDLDSLGLVNLVVSVEEKIEEAFSTSITLADDRALSQEMSPFSTVESLVNYIEALLKEKKASGP